LASSVQRLLWETSSQPISYAARLFDGSGRPATECARALAVGQRHVVAVAAGRGRDGGPWSALDVPRGEIAGGPALGSGSGGSGVGKVAA